VFSRCGQTKLGRAEFSGDSLKGGYDARVSTVRRMSRARGSGSGSGGVCGIEKIVVRPCGDSRLGQSEAVPGESRDGRLSDSFAVLRERKNLSFTGVRTWPDTNRSNTSAFLGFPGWLASGPKRICERRWWRPYLERPLAKEGSRRFHVASERAKAGVAAESVQRRPRHRSPLPGGEKSLFSSRTAADGSRSNGFFHRTLRLLAAGYDFQRSSDCDSHLDRPTPAQAHFELAMHPARSNPTTGPQLAPETQFVDRLEHLLARVRPESHEAIRNVLERTTTAKIVPRFGQRELGAAGRSSAPGYLVSDGLPTQSGSPLGARRDASQEASGRGGRQLRLRSILREDCGVLSASAKSHSDAQVRTLRENFANRSSGTQAAAASCARVASKQRVHVLTDR